MTSSVPNIIIVVGMARSGTTLLTNILGELPNVKVVLEPHALWKTGNFHYLNDEEYDVRKTTTRTIRNHLLKGIGNRTLIEKSPINCIRPHLVHGAFPDAKVIYIERDPVRCIYSNLQRTLKNDSFKPSIVLKKYFGRAGSKDLPNARSTNPLYKQLALSDYPYFLRYVLYMLYQRNIGMKYFPFGTKLKGFKKIVEEEGILAYHVKVFKLSQMLKNDYMQLFGENLICTKMDDLVRDKRYIKEVFDFTDLNYTNETITDSFEQLDKTRILESGQSSEYDQQIEKLLI